MTFAASWALLNVHYSCLTLIGVAWPRLASLGVAWGCLPLLSDTFELLNLIAGRTEQHVQSCYLYKWVLLAAEQAIFLNLKL